MRWYARLAPEFVRHRRAQYWLGLADAAAAKSAGSSAYGRLALEHYRRALCWQELHDLPPWNAGGALPEEDPLIPCVLCSTPIPRAREGQPGTGLYCSGCSNF